MKYKAFFGALAGAIAGVLAWVISLPYLPVKEVVSVADLAKTNDNLANGFTLGTFYGWFHSGLLGLFAGLFISVIYTWNKPILTRLISCVVGTILGALWVCGADAGSDYIGIRIYASMGGANIAGGFLILITWTVFMSTALCTALTIAMGLRKAMVSRLFTAIMMSTAAAFAFRFVADMIVGSFMAMSMIKSGTANMWALSAPGFLASDVVIATVVGAVLAIAERMTRPAWLRLTLGRNEGVTWTVDQTNTRIGYQEGCEVRVQGNNAMAPVHAQIQLHGSNYALMDCGTSFGTFLNGAPIQSAWLRHGDVIQIGPYMFSFNLRKPQNQVLPQGPRVTPAQIEVPSTPMTQTQTPTGAPYTPPSQPSTPVQTPYQPQPAAQPQQPSPIQAPQAPSVSQPQQPDPTPMAASQILYKLIDGFDNGHMLVPGTLIVGRQEGCDIYISWEPTVSRKHVEITVDTNGVTIRDLGSKNGTRVNGVALTAPVVLQSGDVIEVGTAKLTFIAEHSAASVI
jgi:pSer/pThr/pTyr-binding forkhead associated (FHA) protein